MGVRSSVVQIQLLGTVRLLARPPRLPEGDLAVRGWVKEWGLLVSYQVCGSSVL